jgi:undecaprenyl diphosphate synthase
MSEDQLQSIPLHLGFIVDGNRRWARKHGLPAYEGHLAGHNALKEILRASVEKGVKFVSFYVFSTENWKRTEDEVSRIMQMVISFVKDDIKGLVQENTRLLVLGSRDGLPEKVLKAVKEAEAKTAHCTRATAIFCFNYGGQLEIADAAQQCVNDGVAITTDAIRERLYGGLEVPDVDMVVRTSGEERLSNFMLWRAAYSEFMFLEKFWPDMRAEDIDIIIKEYGERNRRFGGS